MDNGSFRLPETSEVMQGDWECCDEGDEADVDRMNSGVSQIAEEAAVGDCDEGLDGAESVSTSRKDVERLEAWNWFGGSEDLKQLPRTVLKGFMAVTG